MASFPAEYRYFHLIIFPLFIASIIPIYHIYTKAICGISCCYKKSKATNHRARKRTHTNVDGSVETVTVTASPSANSPSVTNPENSYAKSQEHNVRKEKMELPFKLRICLFISITLSTIYMILNTIQVSYYFINTDQNYSPILFCKLKNSLQVVCYIWGRGSLYFFFIFRGQYIFKSTALQYQNRTIYWIFTGIISACSIATIPTIYIGWAQQRHYIVSDINNQGTICANEIDEDDAVHITVGIIWGLCILLGQLGDIIIAYLTVHITASRLFNVVREQSAKSGNNDTSKGNSMILLVSRLFILLCIAVITSQLAVVLAIFNLEYLIIWYGIDCCINMYCLWLNFGFSSEYYYRYFCGKSCIKCCFPCAKTLALTCTSCGDIQSTSCNQCCDCCCYCCKYCCCNKQSRQNQLELYIKSKAETEMIEYE